MISVQHNMLAENANRQLNINTKKNAKTAEKLSSGYRINRAADDAAGLAISEKMRRQVRGLGQGAENIKDGIGYVQTAEGALNEAQDILQRINQLSVQSANGTNTVSDRAYINGEVQALKAELSRIFSTTTFNEERIWEPDEYTEVVGQKSKTAVRIDCYGMVPGSDVTEANCGALPWGTMQVDKEDDGIKVGWTGRNGTNYSTELITWEEMEKKNYIFDVSDYFDKNNADLFPNGRPLFTYNITADVEEGATPQQVRDAIGEIRYINPGYTLYLDGDNGIGNGNPSLGNGVSIVRGYLNYNLAYDLHLQNIYNFDGDNDPVIEPNKIANNGKSNLTSFPDAASPNKNWTLSFNMKGVGTVTATSGSVSYSSTDNNPVWWYFDSHGNRLYPPRSYSPSPSNGTLENALKTLKETTPGLLNPKHSTTGGTISLNFSLTDSGGAYVGSFSIAVGVSASDSESSVSNRITSALNADTVVDLYTNRASDHIVLYDRYFPSGEVVSPVYGQTILRGKDYFWVQAGAEAGQHIDIEYESLSLYALGMQDTDVLTAESASRAINEVKGALQVVSDQRSLFGAYQNRLEHAYNINKNVEENTQASESLIRDTDIADAMMEYSINNILLQAGTSMLTQANQSSQLITQLLG